MHGDLVQQSMQDTEVPGAEAPGNPAEPALCAQAGTEGTPDSTSIALLEGQLTWLCHIVAAIIRGPYMNSTGDSQVPCPDLTALT